MTPSVQCLDHIVLTVADISKTIAFYTEVLGMTAHSFVPRDGPARQALSFGTQKINLHPATAPFTPHAAAPTCGSADLCFLTQAPLEEWMAHFQRHSIPIEDGPVERTGAMGRLMSLYVRDPDRNLIEVSVAV